MTEELLRTKLKQLKEAKEVIEAAITRVTPTYEPKASAFGGGDNRSMEDGVLELAEIDREIEAIELMLKAFGNNS